MPDDERTVLRRVTEGDRDALRTMLQRYGPAIRDQIAQEIGATWQSSFDADDVMQVTYLEAFLQQESLVADNAPAFEAWLRRIARNNLRDAVKELSRQKRPNPQHRVHALVVNDDSYICLLDSLSDGGDTPSRHVVRHEAAQAIQLLIEKLPADYAQVVRLIDLEGFTAAEVADKMARSTGAIHMLRLRAHDRLRALISQETDFFSRVS